MEWLLMMITVFRIYIAGQSAIYDSIDWEKCSVEMGQCPFADLFYRAIRIAGCVFIFLWPAWLAPYGIACYLFARVFKKIIFYFYYELD